MPDIPFFSGKDAVFRLFLGGPEVVLNAKTWNCKLNATKVADGVNGEDRDRLQTIPNYFEMNSDCFMNNSKLIDAAVSVIANSDAGVAPLQAAGGMRIRILDGSRVSYIATELVLDDWDIRQGGRTDRVMMGLPMRFRYFKKTKAAA